MHFHLVLSSLSLFFNKERLRFLSEKLPPFTNIYFALIDINQQCTLQVRKNVLLTRHTLTATHSPSGLRKHLYNSAVILLKLITYVFKFSLCLAFFILCSLHDMVLHSKYSCNCIWLGIWKVINSSRFLLGVICPFFSPHDNNLLPFSQWFPFPLYCVFSRVIISKQKRI